MSSKKTRDFLPSANDEAAGWRLPVILVLLGLGGMALVYNSRLWTQMFDEKEGVSAVGILSRERGGVRVRSGGSLVWNDVAKGDREIATGDAIFTGRDGEGRLRLMDGSLTELSPNSLVIVDYADKTQDNSMYTKFIEPFVDRTPKPMALKVEKGEVSLKTGSQPVRIVASTRSYTVPPAQPAEIEITLDPEDMVDPIRFSSEKADAVSVSELGVSAELSKVKVKPSDPFKKKKKQMARMEDKFLDAKANAPTGQKLNLSTEEVKEYNKERYKKVAELRNNVTIFDHPWMLAAIVAILLFIIVEAISQTRKYFLRRKLKAIARARGITVEQLQEQQKKQKEAEAAAAKKNDEDAA